MLPYRESNVTAALVQARIAMNVSFLSEFVPIDEELLKVASGVGQLDIDWCKWHSIVERFEAGSQLNIAVLGASMTQGSDANCCQNANAACNNPNQNKCQARQMESAWPHTLEGMFKLLSPTLDVHVQNLALSGNGASAWLTLLGSTILDPELDVIVLDTSINDGGDIPQTYESIFLVLRERLPNTQILVVSNGCPSCLLGSYIRISEVSKYHQIPVIDYARMRLRSTPAVYSCLWDCRSVEPPHQRFWREWNCAADALPAGTWQPGCAHPSWRMHQYMAEAVFFSLSTHSRPTDNETIQNCSLMTQPDLHFGGSVQGLCVHPSTMHSAYESFANLANLSALSNVAGGPHVVSGDWELREDRVGKPGWIAKEDGSVIQFPIEFGAVPMLSVAFLSSYAGLGSLKVSLNGAEQSLSSIWDNQFSSTETWRWDGVLPVEPFESAILQIESLKNSATGSAKVKIVAIAAC